MAVIMQAQRERQPTRTEMLNALRPAHALLLEIGSRWGDSLSAAKRLQLLRTAHRIERLLRRAGIDL